MKAFPLSSRTDGPLSEQEKMQMIERASKAYGAFMEALGIDYKENLHTIDTPLRVSKAWVNDIAASLYTPPPQITIFDNTQGYEDLLFHGPIPIKSICSHHHSPFIGEAYVAYIPQKEGKIIGLSKLNRIVEFHARMPQLQEDLTLSIWTSIDQFCKGNRGVACVVTAAHFCLCSRGVNHHGCRTRTSKLSGDFIERPETKQEFDSFMATSIKSFPYPMHSSL
ncbi:GTP cyclohydrolase [Encephalitozoon hellem]|uniref:GTP cyclohydrolase 1 n=2 Tax=Encephalitozoon hellem TaxID=27973 RepID=A0ABY8CI42_ENCHE|nr:GTP cyclohydrolase [Encephalitozoon hellem]